MEYKGITHYDVHDMLTTRVEHLRFQKGPNKVI